MIRLKWPGHAPALRLSFRPARPFSVIAARATTRKHDDSSTHGEVNPGREETAAQESADQKEGEASLVGRHPEGGLLSGAPGRRSSAQNLAKPSSEPRRSSDATPRPARHSFDQFSLRKTPFLLSSSSSSSEARISEDGLTGFGAQPPQDEFSQWRDSALSARLELAKREKALRQRAVQAFGKKAKPKEEGEEEEEEAVENQKHMLTISGLSPTLKASDFYRLAGTSLSAWNQVVNEVSQERDPWTLEPLGVYRISFASSISAEAYREKLNRLLALARYKMHSPHGLWISSVPTHLRTGTGTELEAEVAAFALAPGSHSSLDILRSRVMGKFPWQRLMAKIIAQSSHHRSHPGVVLLELLPGSLTTDELLAFIKQDEEARNGRWQHSRPYQLIRTLEEDQSMLCSDSRRVPLTNDITFREKLQSRFVIVFKDDAAAWRFIRSWNQRILLTGSEGYTRRTLVNASIVEL